MTRTESMIHIKLFIHNLICRNIQRRIETDRQLDEIILKYNENKDS